MSEFNELTSEEEFEQEDSNIIDCRGDKCRISYAHGANVHCTACYGELNLEHIKERRLNAKEGRLTYRDSPEMIRCNGNKCRIHIGDGRGLHCLSCFGELPDEQ